MATAIGKPLYTDNFTASIERISYARILVETDVSQPLIDSIEIVTPSGTFQQPVEYEWRPSFCTDCMKFRHNVEKCWAKQEEDKKDVQPLSFKHSSAKGEGT
ncbi:hypothetical protein KY285_004880 [Solanum tuberosum]|nr:hypothetical protein KY285_004880 [Solanum tuberosum]